MQKRSLILLLGSFLLLQGCGDDGPTAPGGELSLTLASVTDSGGGAVDPSAVTGTIEVTFQVEGSTENAQDVELLLDGNAVATQPLQGSGSVTLSLNTARLPQGDSLDGSVVRGEFANGEHSLSGRITLSSGQNPVVSGDSAFTFDNADRVEVTHLSGGQGVEGNGQTYWGGEDITLAATPVLYSGLSVGSVSLTPIAGDTTANGGAAADLGSGPGGEVTDPDAPFTFTISRSANAGKVEDAPSGSGHTFEVTGVTNDSGDDVIQQIGQSNLIPLTGFFLDFVAPTVDSGGNSEVTIGGSTVASGTFFSAGGFGVSHVTELGVGSLDLTVDVSVSGTVVASDVDSIDDLDERTDEYTASLTSLSDALGNGSDASQVDGTPQFGVDKGAPQSASPEPAGDIVFNGDASDDDGDLNRFNGDDVVTLDVSDPQLADGNPGAGVDHNSVQVVVTQEDGTDTTFTSSDGAFTTDRNADGTDGDYALDVSGFPDGALTVDVAIPDAALPANTGSQGFQFTLDTTDPTFSSLDPAPQGSSGTSSQSITMDIGGGISDPNFDSAVIRVRVTAPITSGHDDGDGSDGSPDGDGTCESGDELLDVPGDIDQNGVAIDTTFEESFTVERPGSETTTYCFLINAEDLAKDNTGAADPNVGILTTQAEVTWN